MSHLEATADALLICPIWEQRRLGLPLEPRKRQCAVCQVEIAVHPSSLPEVEAKGLRTVCWACAHSILEQAQQAESKL